MIDVFITFGLEVLFCLAWIDVKAQFIFSFLKILFLAVIIASLFQVYVYFTEVLDPFFLIAYVVHASMLLVAGLIVFALKLAVGRLK